MQHLSPQGKATACLENNGQKPVTIAVSRRIASADFLGRRLHDGQ
jgi:hypothetical protein